MTISFPSVENSRQSFALRFFVNGSNERLERLLVIYMSSLKGENEKKLQGTCCSLTLHRPVEMLHKIFETGKR